jgi:hypothetical protein
MNRFLSLSFFFQSAFSSRWTPSSKYHVGSCSGHRRKSFFSDNEEVLILAVTSCMTSARSWLHHGNQLYYTRSYVVFSKCQLPDVCKIRLKIETKQGVMLLSWPNVSATFAGDEWKATLSGVIILNYLINFPLCFNLVRRSHDNNLTGCVRISLTLIFNCTTFLSPQWSCPYFETQLPHFFLTLWFYLNYSQGIVILPMIFVYLFLFWALIRGKLHWSLGLLEIASKSVWRNGGASRSVNWGIVATWNTWSKDVEEVWNLGFLAFFHVYSGLVCDLESKCSYTI